MEHSEIISDALTYMRKAFFNLKNIPRWIILLLYVIVPMFIGGIAAYILLELVALPILESVFVSDNFGFTHNSLSGILLFVSIIIGLSCMFFFPFLQGYIYRILKVGKEAPDYRNKWGLFFSGWRVNAVLLYYSIPLIVISLIYLIIFAYIFPNLISYAPITEVQFSVILTGILTFIYAALEFISFIFVALFAFVGLVHLARSGSVRESTGIKKMKDIISKIGWYDYILSLVIMSIVFLLVTFIFILIGQNLIYDLWGLGILLAVYIFVMIPLATFFAKYLSYVYDSAFNQPEEDDSEFDFF
ncbi:MAG: DUF4013 domain-containing protein [Methanocorpusculum sp.]|nr:DUF4013 domain-containing protein [Methanocorpusculum sp.]